MSAPVVTTHSLSALVPVKFTYKFNKEEKLSNSLTSFTNGFRYYKHEAFENFQDAVLSKKTCLILTDNKSLADVFETDVAQVNAGTISGSLLLRTPDGKYLTITKNDIFVGGTGDVLYINIVPVSDDTVELVVNKSKKLMVDESYPYTIRASSDILVDSKLYRQRFKIDTSKGLVSFRVQTVEGGRYLSYGADQVVRAIGLALNETVVNPYLFTAIFVTSNGLLYGADPKTHEVKYYNELSTYVNQNTVTIKEKQISNTHLLISCPTSNIALSGDVPVNIALTKSNFSSSGTYSTKQPS